MSSPLGPAAPGDVIAGRYRIESWLGQGNMAAVYRAMHRGTGQSCALKLVHAHLVERPEIRDLFLREARIGARIGPNPYIVNVFDAEIDTQRGVPYLAMELLEGDTLDKYVKQRGPVPPGLLRMLFLQLADALGQAHAARVVHRDLKPGNLFLTYDRNSAPLLKVVDFGIAKVMEDAQGTATQVGSPAYAAPEQLGQAMRPMTDREGIVITHRISPATDIWALGVIAYELLLGAPPGHLWTGAARGSLADVMMGVAINPTPSAVSRAGSKGHLLPRGFDAWLDRCLRKNADERWPTVKEAVRVLADLLDHGYGDSETQQIPPTVLLGVARKDPERTTIPIAGNQPPAAQAPAQTAFLPPGFYTAAEPTAPPPPQAQAAPPAAVKGANARTLPLSNSLAHARPAAPPTEPSPAKKRSSPGDVQTVLLDLPPAPQPPPSPVHASQPSQHELAPQPPPPELRASQPSQHEIPHAAATAHGLAGTHPPAQRETKRGAGLVLGGFALLGAVGLAVFTLLPKKGRLLIDVSDAGNTKVEVFVDGTKQCDTVPCIVGDVAPGARTIKVIPQGAAPLQPQEAIVERGEDKPVTFSMVAQSHEGATSGTAHATGAISEVKPIETAPLTPSPEAPPTPAPDGSTIPPPQPPTQEGPTTRPTSTAAGTPAQVNSTLNINSIPVSKVILDGRPLGNTPRVGLSVPPGTHTVVFVHPEKGRQTVSISVKPGETKTAAVKFR